MSDSHESEDPHEGVGTLTKSRVEEKLQPPSLYRVLLHNDDYTTREFVIEILQNVFHHDESNAVRIMFKVHNEGVGIAGVYPYEIAEMKIRAVEKMAKSQEFPLMLSLEPEEQ